MILVLGGNGTIGSEVVKSLQEKKASIRLLVQNKDKAKAKFGDKVDIICGDFNNEQHVREALRGVERLFLITPSDEKQVLLEKRIIDDAQAEEIQHIVKLSVYGADISAESNSLIKWHAEVEEYLLKSKIPSTIIRANNFFSNLGRDDSQTIKKEGKIYKCTQDAKLSFTHPKDIGEAAATVLCSPIEEHKMCTYNITGPESLSYYELADRIGMFFNKKVEYVDLEDSQIYQALSKTFKDKFTAKMFVKLFQFYRRGGASHVSGDYKIITGKESRTWENYFKKNQSLFV